MPELTVIGLPNAIKWAEKLEEKGHRVISISTTDKEDHYKVETIDGTRTPDSI